MELEIGECFLLDWRVHELWIQESHKDVTLIEALVKGIELGDRFAPVLVNQTDDNHFSLIYGGDGGHHRSAAHYICDKPMLCKVFSKKRYEDGVIPIEDMTIGDIFSREILVYWFSQKPRYRLPSTLTNEEIQKIEKERRKFL